MIKPKYKISAYVELDRRKLKGNRKVNPIGIVRDFKANKSDPLYGWYSIYEEGTGYGLAVSEDCILKVLPMPNKVRVKIPIVEYFDFNGNYKILEERVIMVDSIEEAIETIKETLKDYGDYLKWKIEDGVTFRFQRENSILSVYPTINSFDFSGLVGDEWSNTIIAEKFFGDLEMQQKLSVKHEQYPRNLFNI